MSLQLKRVKKTGTYIALLIVAFVVSLIAGSGNRSHMTSSLLDTSRVYADAPGSGGSVGDAGGSAGSEGSGGSTSAGSGSAEGGTCCDGSACY